MARLNLKAIEERVAPLGGRESYDREFLFDLLLAYGKPKSVVTRLRNGSLNVAADTVREVAQKNVVYFRDSAGDPLAEIEELRTAAHVVRFNPRFIITTDFSELLAIDTKTGENLVISIHEIDKHFTFFLPWAGMEKAQYVAEAHADVKAAERIGKLFDELVKANPGLLEISTSRHALNVFFTRLLFCFFAEDTSIFKEGQFTTSIGSHTQEDGSDTHEFITAIFAALDTEAADNKPAYVADFPYVNGRLFSISEDDVVPQFTRRARELLLDLGALKWDEINPDIFGSMFQAIVTPGSRSNLGQHYTSVPNILKTIEPLFLDDLKEEFDTGFDSVTRLKRLHQRISEIKVFDPACGSGNFLVIAYKELRRLEHAILERLADLDNKHRLLFTESKISIENFYGIEIDDFASEIAILSMWIAKHQMNNEFKDKFGVSIPLIPLKQAGQIRVGNATQIDWNHVCPNDGVSEIYLISNPPYKGAKTQTRAMKEDFPHVFGSRPYSKNLDYVALWFIKGADYIEGTMAQLSFVATNSIVQGEHVGLMFPMIFEKNIEIGYAYTSFKWENSAKRNAGVTVVVINLRPEQPRKKYLYTDDLQIEASHINGYLTDYPNIYISRSTKPRNALPPMGTGSQPIDGGHLILSAEEARELESDNSTARFVKSFLGANEYIRGIERFTLWIPDKESEAAERNKFIASRIERVREMRLESTREATKGLAAVPWRFGFRNYQETDSIIVPSVSSERREYIPIGYLDPETVISNLAFAIYDAVPWLFALLTSRLHMVWTRAVGGALETRLRYSNTLVYNNFPVPPLSTELKEKLTMAALRVLDVREYHCEKTLAELYDPDKMPADLREAHRGVDDLVESIYSKRGYENDEERLSDLFAKYEEMRGAEEAKNSSKESRR